MSHHAIYIPGIGDHRTLGQDGAIQLWRLYGLTPHYLALGWHRGERIELKLDRLRRLIKALASDGSRVSLVGASAGASAALTIFAESEKVTGFVYICGKINFPQNVAQSVYRANADFEASLMRSREAIKSLTNEQKARMLNMHPRIDLTVPPDQTRIPGVEERLVPGIGHRSGIALAITAGAPMIATFLRGLEARL